MFILLSTFNIWISLFIIVSIIPQAIITYKLQKEAFETLVMRSPEARKMNYYSNVLLSKDYAQEVRLFNTSKFFIKKYLESFNRIHSNVKDVRDRKSTRLNSSHVSISYAVFCLKKKKCYNL